ncbi:MAG: glycosyltransferase family 4 protein [Candidatus Helarchaeota archaeon]
MGKKKIKICLISLFSYPLYNKKCLKTFGGGAAVQLYLLSKELAKNNNFDISIIVGKYSERENKIEQYEKIKLYNVIPLKRNYLNYIIGGLTFLLNLFLIKPDIIIQRLADTTTFLSALYCKFFRCKFIFSIGLDTDINGKSEKGFFGKLFRYGLRYADKIIAQNNDQVKILSNRNKKLLNKIIIIKNGYKFEDIKNSKKSYILWVGRAVKWKRPELFIKLAENFQKEKFLMVCYCERDKNYWKKILLQAKKVKNLTFYDFIPFNRINKIYQKAKVLINTSLYEGFPNSFLQAFICKTPVISLNVNPENILNKNKIGFCCNNNFNKMKIFLDYLIKNETLYNLYSKNAYMYVKQHHNIEKIALEWITLINKILNYQKLK